MNEGFVILFMVGLVGMTGHMVKKYLRDHHDNSTFKEFYDFTRSHPMHSVAALLTYVGAYVALIQMIDDPTSPQSLLLGFTTGFTADSTVNKSPSRGDYRRNNYPPENYGD